MNTTSGLAGWRHVLEQIRRFNTGGQSGGYDLRPYWRVRAYRRHAGEPETLVRAHAFASVLDHMPLHLYEGDTIIGSQAGFVSRALPEGVPAVAYAQAVAEHDARGQRDFLAGFDHTLPDYPTLLAAGIGGLIRHAEESLAKQDEPARKTFLESICITLKAFSRFVQRYADTCRKAGLEDGADSLDAVVLAPPRTFREALQLVWLTHLAMSSEGRGADAVGRIDQYLLPFYRGDIQARRLTRESALDLLCHLWAKIEELGEVTNICIGGLTPEGRDATNPLSYVCLDATRLVLSPSTNLSARFHDDSPESFHRACFDCISTGVGFPAIFNDHVLIQGLAEIGIPLEVARDYCMVGCIETMLAGRQQAWSDSRFNTPLFMLNALQKLRGEPERSFDRLMAIFEAEIREAMRRHKQGINEHIGRYPVERFPDPFLSALTRDCIARGLDINNGGALFKRFHGICIMGLATVADSLAAVKKLVFEDQAVDFDTFMKALDANFEGYAPLRLQLINRAPKYGNADPYVDDIAAWLVSFTAEECLVNHTADGGRFVSAMAANTSNIPAGREVGATPDGRLALMPLSDAASPYFGRDLNGPTAFLQSVATPDYHKVLTGSVVNMKFEPEHFQGEEGARRFSAVTHALVRDRIQELQFNFTGNATLMKAQENPDQYPSLVVRVSGFSAYFTRLPKEVQDDIIRRRAHV